MRTLTLTCTHARIWTVACAGKQGEEKPKRVPLSFLFFVTPKAITCLLVIGLEYITPC